MPQNFRTRSVRLHQRQVEAIEGFPRWPAPPGSRRMILGSRDYGVVDVVLIDGRQIEGLLVEGDDTVLVPEHEPPFESGDILSLRPTPVERHPDFTVTDPSVLWTGTGRSATIEMGNMWREAMFGPPDADEATEAATARARPVDEAWEEAERHDAHIEHFPGDIERAVSYLGDPVLTRDGVRLSVAWASGGERETIVVRPQGEALWRRLLHSRVTVGDDCTVGSVLALLQIQDERVAALVSAVVLPWSEGDVRDWARAAAADGFTPGGEMVEVVVSVVAENDDGEVSTWFDASGLSAPLTVPQMPWGVGDRVRYSLSWGGPARLRDLPLRVDETMIIPLPHEVLMRWMRGPLRDWREAGEPEPRPEEPVVARLRRPLTLAELLRGLLTDMSPENTPEDEYHRDG